MGRTDADRQNPARARPNTIRRHAPRAYCTLFCTSLVYRTTPTPTGMIPEDDPVKKLESQFNAWRVAIGDQVMFLQLTAAKPLLRRFVAIEAARVLSKKAVSRDDIKAKTVMQTASAIPGATQVALQKFVAAAAHQGTLNITDDAKASDNNYQNCNGETSPTKKLAFDSLYLALHPRSCFAESEHVNDNVRLGDLANELRNLGALEVLKQSMPIETLILQYYKELL